MHKFKAGDKVVCVSIPNRKLNYDKNYITLYKTYTIHSVKYDTVIIIDDNKRLTEFYEYRFITQKKFRLLKLKELL